MTDSERSSSQIAEQLKAGLFDPPRLSSNQLEPARRLALSLTLALTGTAQVEMQKSHDLQIGKERLELLLEFEKKAHSFTYLLCFFHAG